MDTLSTKLSLKIIQKSHPNSIKSLNFLSNAIFHTHPKKNTMHHPDISAHQHQQVQYIPLNSSHINKSHKM